MVQSRFFCDGELSYFGLALNHGEVLEVCQEVPAGALFGDARLLKRRQQLLGWLPGLSAGPP